MCGKEARGIAAYERELNTPKKSPMYYSNCSVIHCKNPDDMCWTTVRTKLDREYNNDTKIEW